MRIVTIEIDEEKDLFDVEEFLDKKGLKYHLDDLEALEKSIMTGYDQSEKGLTRPHAKVIQEFRDKYK
ncbi:MAG TPA: hypothetical protein VG367_11445 [Mucilaginibacter sp.]|jgi:hypothetical protein|nr:hypothetical protein [Mucilaginibacter sp.]